MGNVRGLRSRLCPRCNEIIPHRTLYVKTREGGRPRWLQIFWFCAKCHSLNHIVLPTYRHERAESPLPTSPALGIVNALNGRPQDLDELIMNLRRNRPQGVSHIFNSEVRLALEFLKGHGVVKEESSDRSVRVLELLQTKPRGPGRLGVCPQESIHGANQKSLVSLYAQQSKEATSATKLVSIGVFCPNCQYVSLDLDCRRRPKVESCG